MQVCWSVKVKVLGSISPCSVTVVVATQVRNIELANLGAKAGAVVYTARLVGHPDFSLEATTIRVEAGSTASFAVQCKASTTLPQVQQSSLAALHAHKQH